MKNLFIDSNIWLSVYHFTSDTLEKFEILKELISKEITLLIPTQVYLEVLRNRDNKIKDAWGEFSKLNFQTPAFCQSYPDFDRFDTKYKELQQIHDSWKKAVEQDIRANSLKADLLLSDVFKGTNFSPHSAEIIRAAEIRFKSGNPPGKNKSFGDAINWEWLLETVPNGENLYFITADKDYCSAFDAKSFNLFLLKEWENKKKSKIIFFNNLSDFLKDQIKQLPPVKEDVKIVAEQERKIKAINELAIAIENSQDNEEKESAIALLRDSGSYARTHYAISLLAKYNSWTQKQIERLCGIALENGQVGGIIGDEDVDAFYRNILSHAVENTNYVLTLRKWLSDLNVNEKTEFVF